MSRNSFVLGRPRSPIPGLVVAVAARMERPVGRARRRLALEGLCLLLAAALLVCLLAWLLEGPLGAGRYVVLSAAAAFGALLILGALVGPRPFELRIAARGPQGRISARATLLNLILTPGLAFRHVLEPFLIGRSDPAAEVASWILLALAEAGTPGEWGSLEGLSGAEAFRLPEELLPAVRALVGEGLIELDGSCYPPLVRLTEEGESFVRKSG